jgi:dienelactone hydrolase
MATYDGPVKIDTDEATLDGDLVIPAGAGADGAGGLVLFAHGSGSSRHSSRNRYVAKQLQDAGLATLLFDLLTADEEEVDLRTRHLRFDIDMLARRLVAATDWVLRQQPTAAFNVGYFGASTGAAAALIAAAQRPEPVRAVVSRGGRPDLAGDFLPDVHAPTLLLVGSADHGVIELNEEAYARLRCEKKLELVPRATHLFEEPGTLEAVARLARDWFVGHLVGAASRAS